MRVRELMRMLVEMNPDDEIEFKPTIRIAKVNVAEHREAREERPVELLVPPEVAALMATDDAGEFDDIFKPLG